MGVPWPIFAHFLSNFWTPQNLANFELFQKYLKKALTSLLFQNIFDDLQIKPNETSKNGDFTLTPVECLGACVNAPILQVNDDFYEDLDYESTKKLLESLLKNKPLKFGSSKGRKSEPEQGATVLLKVKGKKNAG